MSSHVLSDMFLRVNLTVQPHKTSSLGLKDYHPVLFKEAGAGPEEGSSTATAVASDGSRVDNL